MSTISDRIILLLDKKKMSKTEFANKLNITQAYVSKITNKGAIPSDRLIEDICEKFNVNDEWLRTGNGEMFVNIDRENQLMMWAGKVLKDDSNDFKQRFVKMLSNLGEDDWKLLEKFALNLIEERPNSEKSDSEKTHEES